jgi:hypothetical protein
MPNYLNDLFHGAFGGAGQIVDKIQMNNRQDDLLSDFRKTSSDLKQASQINFQAQNDILNLVPTEGGRQPIQPEQIPQTDVYDTMINSALQMNAKYGQDASPYINALEGMYKNYFPDPQKPDDTTIGNDIIRRDAKGNYTKVYNGEDKAPSRSIMTGEETYIEDNGKYYKEFPVQENGRIVDHQRTEITKKEYEDRFNEGQFAKTTGTGTRRRYSGTRTKQEADTLSTVAENNLNYNDMTDEEKTKFDKSKQELADKYGMTPDELNQYAENYRVTGDKEISDDEVTTANIQAYQQDLSAFQNDIETKVYAYPDAQGNMQPNYSISPDDWFRELNEAGFFDNISASHYQIISDWFKSKTGVALRKYVKGE